jgi:osmotically inducible protein OsmC
MPTRRAEATWKGDLKSGQGWFKGETGAVEGTFTAGSRFENESGSNPEELLGAAHAGCFSQAFSLELTKAGFTPEAIDTTAHVTIEKQGDGFAITGISLTTKADVPGISNEQFQKIAEGAKTGCPVSQALKAVPISLEATLVSS